MASGFIVEDAAVTSIGTSYDLTKVILLHEDTARDARSRAMPSSGHLSHLELQLDETTATVAAVSAKICWDSAGDDPMTAEATSRSTTPGMTDTSLRNVAISLDVDYTAPTGQTTTGKCYLLLKVDAGAASLTKARLHWRDSR